MQAYWVSDALKIFLLNTELETRVTEALSQTPPERPSDHAKMSLLNLLQ